MSGFFSEGFDADSSASSGSAPLPFALTEEEISRLFPKAVEWIAAVEARILAEGVALTGAQRELARRAGVAAVDRVRLLAVTAMPPPEDGELAAVLQAAALVSSYTAGMTFKYGIALRADCWEDEGLLAHELVHVGQYERLGGIAGFLVPYIQECLFPPGYPHGPMEAEAIAFAAGV